MFMELNNSVNSVDTETNSVDGNERGLKFVSLRKYDILVVTFPFIPFP